jgi:hypothetical protein
LELFPPSSTSITSPLRTRRRTTSTHAVLKLKENPAVDYRGIEEILNVELTTSGQEVHERILRGWQILAHYTKHVTMIKRRGAPDVGELSVEVALHAHAARIEVEEKLYDRLVETAKARGISLEGLIIHLVHGAS